MEELEQAWRFKGRVSDVPQFMGHRESDDFLMEEQCLTAFSYLGLPWILPSAWAFLVLCLGLLWWLLPSVEHRPWDTWALAAGNRHMWASTAATCGLSCPCMCAHSQPGLNSMPLPAHQQILTTWILQPPDRF